MIEDLIPKEGRRELSNAYKLRSKFWATSVCAHIVWIFIATQIHLEPKPLRPIYDEFIRPLERRVLVYRPPVKTATATPETRVGKSADARGAVKSPRTIIATAPKAQSNKQIIFKPVNLPEIKLDVPAPNVVARIETALPPPPPKVQAKQFTAPTRAQRPTPQTIDVKATLPDAQADATPLNNPRVSTAALPKFAAKQFTPPPPSQRQPKAATPVEVSANLVATQAINETPASPAILSSALPPAPKTPPKQFIVPAAPGAGARPSARPTEITENLVPVPPANTPQVGPAPSPNALPGKVPAKQFNAPATAAVAARPTARATEVTGTLAAAPTISNIQGAPPVPSTSASRLPGPPKDVPPSVNPTRGNSQADIAIASVNPNPSAAVPAASRPGQFSVAPVVGEPSSGAAAPGALVVPNLTVRDPAVPKPDPAKSNTVIYAERVRSAATGAFAIPLRPANRSIPRAVDARFAGRSVYTVLIPIENLPAYGGDWILWFAELAPQAGQTPSMRAPVPIRKIELLEKNRETTDTRLQIAAKLGKDGKLAEVKVLSAVPAEMQELALEDVSAWEWKPATRNGVAIDIEAVFEIPFRLAKRP
jgi:hypothetical protein